MVELDKEARRRGEEVTPICGIGASAGGVAALQQFFSSVRADLGFAYVVIVHLAPDHPSQLADILSTRTSMPVLQVEDTPVLRPNCVYVISPDRELVIEGDSVHARPFAQPRGRRAPIDMFFRSVAAARGDGVTIVLSGAGSDGAVGVRRVKEAGGLILVQEPGEAEYPMMPRSAIATGVADYIAPVAALAERVAEIARDKQALRQLGETEADAALRRIMGLLHMRTGHDFSSYKRPTLLRRVTRRMQVARRESLADYCDYVLETPEEAQELFSDLLISVTSFFRDPAAYEALAEDAIAPLFDELDGEDAIRVWSVGCATGEEAYSLGMLMLEEAERRRVKTQIQIFATDLDEGALATAREGRFPKAIEADVPEERLRRFFIEEGAHYRIRKEVRDLVLFARHSAVKDPPFMRIKLIACRNLLIYMERELQRQMLALFHYALEPGGYLFLGSAESADAHPGLFAPSDREARLYIARPRAVSRTDLMMRLPSSHRPHLPEARAPRERTAPAPGPAHVAALEALAPPSALVDEEQRVLNLSETAGRFILPSAGPLSSELPDIVRPELRTELRAALFRALEGGETSLTLPASVAFDGMRRRVMLHVAPAAAEEKGSARRALVLFLDGGPSREGRAEGDEAGEAAPPGEAARLQAELRATQERLAASRREHESAIQDLRIANEELQSINEEYRSTAEELETSKEELQSINEELQTVNSELKSKLDSIASAHSDLQNLINATEIGTLFLDAKLRVKMLTPAVEQLFSVTDSDIGRPITDFTHKLAYDGVEQEAMKVLRDLTPIESEVATRDGRWLMMRLRPYRTIEDRIEGVVLSFVDITQRREAEERYRTLFEAMDEGFLLVELEGGREGAEEPQGAVYRDANPAARRLVKAEFRDRRFGQVDPGFESGWRHLPTRVLRGGGTERVEFHDESIDQWFDLAVTKVDESRVAVLFKEITARKRHEAERELMVGELNHRVKNMLAVVQSIARQTRRATADPAAFADAFERRLQALARAHNLLTESHWRGSDLVELARAALDTFVDREGKRVRIDGPPVRLSPNATISFAMALHELATNALKHGALSRPEGAVDVAWRIEAVEGGGCELRFEWRERGGPPVGPPDREGFGMRMLQKGVARELKGEVALDHHPDGLVCRMRFPFDGMLGLTR